jgi:hypothetical protein
MEPKIHYSVYKSQQLVPILRQTNQVYSPPPYFPKIRCKIILPSSPSSSERSLASFSPTKIFYEVLCGKRLKEKRNDTFQTPDHRCVQDRSGPISLLSKAYRCRLPGM